MTAEEFRARIEPRFGGPTGFARWLAENGDPRSLKTILRSVSNWSRGVAAVPGEVCVLLNLLPTDRQNGSRPSRKTRNS